MKFRSLCICFFIVTISSYKVHMGHRRITGGREVEGDRRYMVYFLKKNGSEKYYGWTCGGALVSEKHILTAAACLSHPKDKLYAIAGYRRYVNAELINLDSCTSQRKRKVVKTCTPKDYNFATNRHEEWANVYDIGIAIVDPPYDFNDLTYELDCSYVPYPIAINFGLFAQRVGNDAVELGWGHTQKLRKPYHLMDHNEEFLREASTQIVNNSICLESFNIDQPEKFICTDGHGNVDSEGNVLDYGELVMGCEYKEGEEEGEEKEDEEKEEEEKKEEEKEEEEKKEEEKEEEKIDNDEKETKEDEKVETRLRSGPKVKSTNKKIPRTTKRLLHSNSNSKQTKFTTTRTYHTKKLKTKHVTNIKVTTDDKPSRKASRKPSILRKQTISRKLPIIGKQSAKDINQMPHKILTKPPHKMLRKPPDKVFQESKILKVAKTFNKATTKVLKTTSSPDEKRTMPVLLNDDDDLGDFDLPFRRYVTVEKEVTRENHSQPESIVDTFETTTIINNATIPNKQYVVTTESNNYFTKHKPFLKQDNMENIELEDINLDYYYDAAESFKLTKETAKEFGKQVMMDLKKKYRRSSQHARRKVCRRVLHNIARNANHSGPSTCQHDHGAPLVSWLGGTEIIIGVAVTTLTSGLFECKPPSVFVSTAFHPYFLKCNIFKESEVYIEEDEIKNECNSSAAFEENSEVDIRTIDWSREPKG